MFVVKPGRLVTAIVRWRPSGAKASRVSGRTARVAAGRNFVVKKSYKICCCSFSMCQHMRLPARVSAESPSAARSPTRGPLGNAGKPGPARPALRAARTVPCGRSRHDDASGVCGSARRSAGAAICAVSASTCDPNGRSRGSRDRRIRGGSSRGRRNNHGHNSRGRSSPRCNSRNSRCRRTDRPPARRP